MEFDFPVCYLVLLVAIYLEQDEKAAIISIRDIFPISPRLTSISRRRSNPLLFNPGPFGCRTGIPGPEPFRGPGGGSLR
jgi:hypothetical protein